MIHSIILKTASRLLVPIMLLFALQLLLEGHHAPGGGFSGGLVAAGAYALYAIAFGVKESRRALPIDPLTLLAIGLGLALLSGALPVLLGGSFLQGLWTASPEDAVTDIGTPLLFDLGVFLVVVGATLAAVFEMESMTGDDEDLFEKRADIKPEDRTPKEP